MINEAIFDEFPVLETQRLRLRQIAPADAAQIFALRSHPDAMHYIGKPLMKDLEEAEAWVELVAKVYREREGITWVIDHKEGDTCIGNCGFWRMDKPHVRAEIGYSLLPDYWRKGIITEALTAIIDFGFYTISIHSVEANIHPENLASSGSLKKLGFVREGYFRESFLDYRGHFEDTETYGLLEKDWQNRA